MVYPNPSNTQQQQDPQSALLNANAETANLEFNAQQMFASSLAHSGQLPNPQFVAESLASGSSSDFVSAYGDPIASPVLTAGPMSNAGGTTSQLGPMTGTPNVFEFNQQQYQSQLSGLINKNQQFSSLGEVPLPNVGYYQSILRGSKDEVSKWQHWLAQTGFLQNGKTDGTVDSNTQQALQAYFTNLFMPQALFSSDPSTKLTATSFLQGIGMDPTKLNASQYNNPSFTTQLVAGWIATQGTQDPKKALNDYMSQFGVNSVPTALQQAANPGFLQSAEDTGWAALSIIPDLFGMIISPLTGGNKIADWMQSIGPAQGEANTIETALKNQGVSQQDIGAISPLLNNVAGDTGWMPFDYIDQQWNRALLTVAYFAGDNAYAHGKDTSNSNPFDPSSPLGQHIASYQNDLLAGLVDPEFAKDHQTVDHIFNFVADSLDPVYWAGGGFTRAEKALIDWGSFGAKTGATLSKAGFSSMVDFLGQAAKDSSIGGKLPAVVKDFAGRPPKAVGTKDVISQGFHDTLAKTLNPDKYVESTFAQTILKLKDTPGGEMNIRRMLGILDEGTGAERVAVDGDIRGLQNVLKASTPEGVLEAVEKEFPLQASGASRIHNMRLAMRGITPNVIDRLGAGVISKLRTFGAFKNVNGEISLKTMQGADHYEPYLHAVGASEAEISQIHDEWLKANNEERVAMVQPGGSIYAAIDKGILKKEGKIKQDEEYTPRMSGQGMQSWQGTNRMIESGSRFGKGKTVLSGLEGPQLAKATYAIDPVYGYTSTMAEELKRVQEGWQAGIDSEILEYSNFVQKGMDKMRKKDPSLSAEDAQAKFLETDDAKRLRAIRDQKIQAIKDTQQALAPLGAERPAPLLTSQLASTTRLPGDLYSLLTHMHQGKMSMMTYEKMASRVKADAISKVWKQVALWQIATQVRIAAGDDLVRLLIDAAQDGHFTTALKGTSKALIAGIDGVAKSNISKLMISGDKRVQKLAAKGKTSKLAKITDKPVEGDNMVMEVPDENGKMVQVQMTRADAARAYEEAVQQRMVEDPNYQNLHKYLQIADTSYWTPFTREDPGYGTAFAHSHRVVRSAPEAQLYAKTYLTRGTKAAEKAAKDFYANDKLGKEAVSIHHSTPENMAKALSDVMQYLYPHRTMMGWVVNGLDTKEFQTLYRNHQSLFPQVASPRDGALARNGIMSSLGSATFDTFMEPFINNARGSIMVTQTKLIADELRKRVQGDPNWTEERIQAKAAQQARAWGQVNLYQGQRTIAGTALRHVFPFFGATANMSKFFLRQFEKHPSTAAEWQRVFGAMETSNNQSNQNPADSSSALLSVLGFTGGDSLAANPAKMFFFTNDGFASFVPGFGPIFGPILHSISQDPQLAAIANSFPGIREQVSANSGNQYTVFPWLEKFVSAVGLMSPLHHAFTAPVFGGSQEGYQVQLDQKMAQMTADNEAKGLPPPTPDEVASELGKEQLTASTASALLPFIGNRITDAKRNQINIAKTALAAATDDASLKTIQQDLVNKYPDLAPYIAYEDPKTPQSQSDVIKNKQAEMGPGTSYAAAKKALSPEELRNNRDDLAQDHPWLIDYTTSPYQMATGVTAEPGLAGFEAQVASGDITPLPVDAYSQKVAQAWQIQNGWEAYEQNIVAHQQSILAEVGGDTSSPLYKQWVQTYQQPVLGILQAQYPEWYAKFISTESTPSSLAGYALKAQPINTLSTWELMPHFTGNESQSTIMWRKALTYRNQAANALASLLSSGGSSSDKATVVSGLRQKLDQLAQEYPQYASQLDMAYFNSWTDVINYEAQLEHNYGYVPAQISGGAVSG